MARRFGAEAVIQARENVPGCLRKLNNGYLADAVIVCTGATEAFFQALQSVESGGTILLFAPTAPGISLPLVPNDVFWRREVTLTTSYAASPADYETAGELIRAQRVVVADMITHRLSLAEADRGFELVASAGDSVKVIISP